jgi:hypothetical protein
MGKWENFFIFLLSLPRLPNFTLLYWTTVAPKINPKISKASQLI